MKCRFPRKNFHKANFFTMFFRNFNFYGLFLFFFFLRKKGSYLNQKVSIYSEKTQQPFSYNRSRYSCFQERKKGTNGSRFISVTFRKL